MEALGEVNATQEELHFLPPPDGDPNNLGYHDYPPNIGILPPVLPAGFEGVNFPEDPIRLLSVQVRVAFLFPEHPPSLIGAKKRLKVTLHVTLA